MTNEITNIQKLEQEFAYVDSLITAHTNAAIAKVNAEALQTYWEVGAYISDHLKNAQWGDHVVSELADYLKRHNPKRRGYSKRNLYNMVTFYENYSSHTFQEVTEQLRLSEFVQLQTAQIKARPIVQMPSAQHHLTFLDLRRCIVNQTFETLMKKDKQMTPALLTQYPGAEYMFFFI